MQPSKWDQGIKIVQKGLDRYENGDVESARNYFERGIQILIDSLKKMPPSNRKFEKQQKINSYLDLLSNLPKKPIKNNQHKNQCQSKQNKKQNIEIRPKKRSKHEQELYGRIRNEIISTNLSVKFQDVVGLENVKQALLEAVILPAQRPDLFTGPRAPPVDWQE